MIGKRHVIYLGIYVIVILHTSTRQAARVAAILRESYIRTKMCVTWRVCMCVCVFMFARLRVCTCVCISAVTQIRSCSNYGGCGCCGEGGGRKDWATSECDPNGPGRRLTIAARRDWRRRTCQVKSIDRVRATYRLYSRPTGSARFTDTPTSSVYSTVSLVPPMSTMDVWRGIT